MGKEKETAVPAGQQSNSPVPKGRVLAIGGHEDKGDKELTKEQKENKNFTSEQILKRFVAELKAKDPFVVIVPIASAVPDKMVKEYADVFKGLGIKNIGVISASERDELDKPEFFEMVDKAHGIMFTGGDQLQLTAIMGGTQLLERMKVRYTKEDILIAGSSAGAAALSTPMIYKGKTQGGFIKGDVRVTTGLEFLKNIAIDTHFISRGRIVRMAQAIATNPGCIGIGLESDTAMLVTEGRVAEVVGSGLITVVDGTGITRTNIYRIKTGEPFSVRDLKVHLLSNGEKYEFPTYEQLHI
ncbi:cyanophycinase [Pontibacter ummariensis]|uniref:Cyanophycinase n=1 Tax=Pontibacter ummariensis TaxID=1610492 RepID=A0A239LH14_9BACT|nr:cyanophycinase [Pontibacter ummariensis]PRY03387.1 cyanophycinase [Pontibacter ummariensis]SNT29168.1 cyanophycinase [Pontibacter ummariensis]